LATILGASGLNATIYEQRSFSALTVGIAIVNGIISACMIFIPMSAIVFLFRHRQCAAAALPAPGRASSRRRGG
jgi:hypothetical protein